MPKSMKGTLKSGGMSRKGYSGPMRSSSQKSGSRSMNKDMGKMPGNPGMPKSKGY